MATLATTISIKDSNNTATDNRKAGLTPTVSNGKTFPGLGTVLASTVTVTEIGSGDYFALYDAEANGDASFPIDWGAALANPNDRYGTLILTRDSDRILTSLDAAISTRLAAASYAGLPSGVVVTASSASSVIVSGLPTGKNFVGQFLLDTVADEKRTIAGQSFAGGNYTFTFGSGVGIAGPFSAAPTTGQAIYLC